MGLKEKVKTELGYMKKGAKVLPKVVGKKVTGWAKGQYEAAKQRAILEREIEAEAKKAEREAYKEERIKIAREDAVKRARKKASGKGILAQLGEAGERMSLSDLIGSGGGKGIGDVGSTSDYIFSGFGQQKKKPSKVVVHHHIHHYPKKKKRK